MSEHVVVVGGGMVAHRFVEALTARDTGSAFHVTVVAEEDRAPYDRVGLSAFFSGSTPEDLTLGDPSLWESSGTTLRTGSRRVARPRRAVRHDRGRHDAGLRPPRPRDRLVRLGAPGGLAADLAGVFVYRTIDDVVALRDWVVRRAAELGRPVRGAVIGGGLLGLEAAGAVVGLGAACTVVELRRGSWRSRSTRAEATRCGAPSRRWASTCGSARHPR